MDPLEQIKQIIVESEQMEKENDEGEKNEMPMKNGAKSMQMRNVEASRSQSEPGSMPQKGAETVLSAPGVEMIKALIDKIPQAVPPDRDPKAKSSSMRMNPDSMGSMKKSANPEMENETEEEYEPGEGNEDMETINERPGMKEHLDALFNGEQLSEDFQQKAALIFEAALTEREEALRAEIAAEYETLAEEYVEIIRSNINEQVDSYLGYVVNEWSEQNQLEIENGVRLEIAESFIEGLRGLFLEHGIDVPDSDVNLVEELADKVAELEGRLNEEINRNIEMNEAVESYRRNEVIATLGEDLTAAEFERFTTLCENVSYDSDQNFINKIATIKESYFGDGSVESPSSSNFLTEETEIENANQETPEMINENIQLHAEVMSRLFGKR